MASDVGEAVAAIRAGLPVLLPTDTVYGLCASPYREEPVARAYRLKGRPETVPSALLCSDVDMMLECMPDLHGHYALIARALFPGGFTLVFPNPGRRYRWLNGDARETIGIRVPALEGEAREVLEQVGAVMATSANRHHGLDPRRLEDVPREIREGCAAEIDGGELPGVPSTVVDLTGPEPRVLREGAVPAAEALERLAAVPGLIEVRRAGEADLELMQRLWDDFSAEATFTPYPPGGFDPALVRDHVALVADQDGEVVGTVYANLSGSHFGYVFGVYTIPEARGRGVGRELMRAVARLLREEGREWVILSVDTPNEGARAFYDRLGFEDASRMLRTSVDRLLAD